MTIKELFWSVMLTINSKGYLPNKHFIDKTAKVEVTLVVLGFFFIALSGYLISSLFSDYPYIIFTLFFVGLGLVRYGLKYRDRDKINKEIRQERERRKGIPKTNSEVAALLV